MSYNRQSSIIAGYCNRLCCSTNSVIIGGSYGFLCRQDNTVMLNGTTIMKQTVEKALEDSVIGSTHNINFTQGAIKYLSSLSSDFQVDFNNFPNPVLDNSVITYTLILAQGATPYMITGLTINGGSLETIKWSGGNTPTGNANQVDTIGLMFVYNNSGTLSQVLGQVGTFA